MSADEGPIPGELSGRAVASRYRVLVEVADRGPAVSQAEIAEALGVTPQAVSEHVRSLASRGHVERGGRGRHEVTRAGTAWLRDRTRAIRAYAEFVAGQVLGPEETVTALAAAPVEAGEPVALAMDEGVVRARPEPSGSDDPVGTAVTDAPAGGDVGVTAVDGSLGREGRVRLRAVPAVRDGGGGAVDTEALAALAGGADLLAVAGTEALAAVRAAGLDPDVRYGAADASADAAARGLDVVAVVAAPRLPAHVARLREAGVGHEVVEG